jgi:hypothetical protein
MASNGNSRGGLLSAGGVLSILAGTFQIIGGVLLAVFSDLGMWLVWRPMQSGPDFCGKDIGRLALIPQPPPPVWLAPTIVGSILIILGIIAIGGGVSAIRRRSFGLSLAGAICALPLVIFGWYLAVGALAEVVFFQSLAMGICGLASVTLGILAVVFVALGKREFRAKA